MPSYARKCRVIMRSDNERSRNGDGAGDGGVGGGGLVK